MIKINAKKAEIGWKDSCTIAEKLAVKAEKHLKYKEKTKGDICWIKQKIAEINIKRWN